MKQILLTKGKIALVDDEDFERLNRFKWYADQSDKTFYARRRLSKHGKMVHMHREILNINDTPKLFADHIDHNGLNNQKSNLRLATRSDNNSNRRCVGASGYLGVFRTSAKKETWFARIIKHGKRNYLGSYSSREEAALAYNKAAIDVHGEFANLNIVETYPNIYGKTG